MDSLPFDKGEKKNVWIEVSERDDGAFSIASATFEVLDPAGTIIQANAAATVDSTKVYGLVDTTTSSFAPGGKYQVKFYVTIGSEIYVEKVPIELSEKEI